MGGAGVSGAGSMGARLGGQGEEKVGRAGSEVRRSKDGGAGPWGHRGEGGVLENFKPDQRGQTVAWPWAGQQPTPNYSCSESSLPP